MFRRAFAETYELTPSASIESFPELRGLLRDGDNSYLVMFGMVLLSALRYLASTCSYTAVMVGHARTLSLVVSTSG